MEELELQPGTMKLVEETITILKEKDSLSKEDREWLYYFMTMLDKDNYEELK